MDRRKHHRSDRQIEAAQKNLTKGGRGKKLYQWNDAELHDLAFPWNHSAIKDRDAMDTEEITRLIFLGSTLVEGHGRTTAEHFVIGWRSEKLSRRRELIRKHVFRKKAVISVKELLGRLLPLADGWPERSRRVQEMVENLHILIQIAGEHGYQFPENHRIYLSGRKRLDRGNVATGNFASFYEVLLHPKTLLDLESAHHLACLIVVYNQRFCSRSASAYFNGVKSAEKRKLAAVL